MPSHCLCVKTVLQVAYVCVVMLVMLCICMQCYACIYCQFVCCMHHITNNDGCSDQAINVLCVVSVGIFCYVKLHICVRDNFFTGCLHVARNFLLVQTFCKGDALI